MASLPVPAWVLYAGLAYPALLYEVLTDQSYAQHATLTTVREDAVRVAVCLAGWASLFIGLRVVPRALLPAWLTGSFPVLLLIAIAAARITRKVPTDAQ